MLSPVGMRSLRVVFPLILSMLLGVSLTAAQDVQTTPEVTVSDPVPLASPTVATSPVAESTPELTPGVATQGVLTRQQDTIAQVFTFEGAAGDNIRLVATSEDGLALALLLTDSNGNLVGQTRDAGAVGEAVIQASLAETGTYFVTVLPVVGVVNDLSQGTYALVLETNASIADDDVTVETTEVAAPAATQVPLAAVTPTATPEPIVDVGETVVTTNGMQVTLAWNAGVDLDLEVRDPVGNTVYFNNPVVDFGGTFSNNVNASCNNVVSSNASETASWTPGGVPLGSYEVLVYYQQDCGNIGAVNFTLNVTVDGQALQAVNGTMLPQQVFITSFELEDGGAAAMSGRAGIEGDETLPATAAALVSGAQPIEFGVPVQGAITSEQPFQSFSFTAPAQEVITVTMNATTGSLDPYLALLDPNGNLLYFNDDAAEGITDAALSNSVLAVAGTYTIVTTRFGMTVGGTEGDYTLSLAGVLSGGAAPTATLDPLATQVVTAPTVPAAPQTLPADVVALALPEGSIEVTLLWNTAADLQLLVRDPAGESVFDDSPQIRSGGRLGATGNVNCTTTDTSPVSYIYWPTTITPRAGSYEIDVWFQSECNDTTPVSFSLYVTVNNQPVMTEVFSASSPFLLNEHFITSFTINTDGTVVAGEGGISGITSLNWEAEAASAQPLAPGGAVNGSITPTNTFDLYAFDGLAGDVVSVSMNASPGTNLDTKLYLIGPNGAVVTQNDDAVAGENTDSLINNFTLPDEGQYIIIATHYGDQYGITTGAYTLSLDL